MSTRSVCVASRDTQRAPFLTHTTTNALECLVFHKQRVEATPEETWLKQHFRATDRHSNSYRVTTCSLCADTRFQSKPLPCTRYTTRVTINTNHIPSRTSPFPQLTNKPSLFETFPNRAPIELAQIAFPTIVLPEDDRTNSFREERLDLPYRTMT